jgi:hypothetical protein
MRASRWWRLGESVKDGLAHCWQEQRRTTGSIAPKPQGGNMRSRYIEGGGRTFSRSGKRAGLAKIGLNVSVAGLHRFFVRHGMTRKKKTGHAIEQDRPHVLKQRHDWFDGQLDLEPERLVFIDEPWTATNMTRSHGRCAKGERLRMGSRMAIANPQP